MVFAKRNEAMHRLASLCALVAILLYQAIAAFHFATDEAHLAHATTSIQVPSHPGHAQHGPRNPADGHSHGHFGELCSFCVLAGVSLPPMPTKAPIGSVERQLHVQMLFQSARAERRLRVNHPVRAPPRPV